MEKLTYDDLEILLKAVDVWEKEPLSDGMMGAIIGGMMTKGKENIESVFEEQMSGGKDKAEVRRKQAIMLKAKLVTLQNEVAAKEISDEISS